MKKKNILKLIPLSLITLIGACSSTLAPTIQDRETPIIAGSEDDILGDIYDDLYSGNANSTAFNWVVNEIATRLEITTKRAGEIDKRVVEIQEDWLENSSYYFNDRFYEKKLVTSLTNLGYTIACDNGYFTSTDRDNNPWNQDPALRLEFIKNGQPVLKCDYSDYIERAIKPTILQSMIEEEYIINNRLEELAGAKRVRQIETLTFPKESVDLELSLFIEKVSKSLQGEEVDFSDFQFPYPVNGVDVSGQYADSANGNYKVIPLHQRTELKTYEYIWKNYRKYLNDKEFSKLGPLGNPAETEETEESKKASAEEKKKIIDKYTANNTQSLEYGFWKAALDIDKVEYIKEDTYSTDSAPYSGFLKNVLFNKNSDATEESILFKKIYEQTIYDDQGVATGEKANFLIDVNSYEEDSAEVILYQTDNANNQYVFIKILDLFTDQLDETEDHHYRAAKAYAPTLSIGRKAFVEYFKEFDLQFGDESVFEYFKNNYPDYFKED